MMTRRLTTLTLTPTALTAAALTAAALTAIALTAVARPAKAQPSPDAALPTAGWLASETAADYRAQARFPAHVRALGANDADPIVDKRTPTTITVAAQADQGTSLTVWPAEVAFVSPQPAVVFARMSDINGRTVAGDVRGEVVDERGVVRAKLAFFDDGVAPDAAAGDGVHTATYRPSARALTARALSARAESLLARVSALPRGDQTAIEAVTGFLISRPGARLTGRVRDHESTGDLVIGAEVLVKRPGRYHLQATIESAGGALIGTAQGALELEPGRHWFDLGFYGLLFTERGIAGPYRVAALTLTDATGMPNALGEVVTKAHTTRGYPLDGFTRRAYGDPALLETARRLDADAARSRGATNPRD